MGPVRYVDIRGGSSEVCGYKRWVQLGMWI